LQKGVVERMVNSCDYSCYPQQGALFHQRKILVLAVCGPPVSALRRQGRGFDGRATAKKDFSYQQPDGSPRKLSSTKTFPNAPFPHQAIGSNPSSVWLSEAFLKQHLRVRGRSRYIHSRFLQLKARRLTTPPFPKKHP